MDDSGVLQRPRPAAEIADRTPLRHALVQRNAGDDEKGVAQIPGDLAGFIARRTDCVRVYRRPMRMAVAARKVPEATPPEDDTS